MDEKELETALRNGLLDKWGFENSHHLARPGVYYPSYLGICIRKQFYIYTIGEKPSPETLAIFATGEGVHEAVAGALKRSIKVEGTEMITRLKVNEEVALSGRIDLLISDQLGEKYVVEVKSTSSIPEIPRYSHIMQLEIYLLAMGINTGFVLYWNKGNGEIKAFKATKSDEWKNKIMERSIMLDYFVRTGQAPPQEAYIEGRNWECDACSFLDSCKPGQ